MTYTLRPYQQGAVDAGVAYLTNPRLRGRNGLIVAPTGSGKSLTIAGIATRLDGPCIVFQPSKEILEQNAAKFAAYGYRPAIFSASVGRREVGAITLATIGSVTHHTDRFAHVRYALVDECHLTNAKGGMYRDFFGATAHARVLGLTATPFRLSSTSFGAMLKFLTRTRPRLFHDVVHATQIGDLFQAGYLAPLEYDTRALVDVARLRPNATGADYADASLSLALYYQMVGRVVRPHPDKRSARVVDLVGLVARFGRVEDLTLRPGGRSGEQWVMASGDRVLTNVYYGEPRDGVELPAWAERQRIGSVA